MSIHAQVEWISPVPEECQLCETPIDKVFIDGRTKMGPWGIMCRDCHNDMGCGLGTGNGQMYRLTNGRWVKTCG